MKGISSVCLSNVRMTSVYSPLVLKCSNDILCTRLLTLSPLAKVWMVISLLALTCYCTSTHAHTYTHTLLARTKYWLRWFVTSFPPLLPSHLYWFLLGFSCPSLSFSHPPNVSLLLVYRLLFLFLSFWLHSHRLLHELLQFTSFFLCLPV